MLRSPSIQLATANNVIFGFWCMKETLLSRAWVRAISWLNACFPGNPCSCTGREAPSHFHAMFWQAICKRQTHQSRNWYPHSSLLWMNITETRVDDDYCNNVVIIIVRRVVWRLFPHPSFSKMLMFFPPCCCYRGVSFLLVSKYARPKRFRRSAGVDRWSCSQGP